MAGKSFHFNGIQAILTDLGMPVEQANTIASASQAVDDFHQDKLIVFDDGKMFYPVVTAHRMLDADNIDSRDASNVWMPFHFFPDSDGVCRPGTDNLKQILSGIREKIGQQGCSQVKKDMYTGILMHIMVDTYTHQGFIGLHCQHNDISRLDDENELNLGFLANFPPPIGHGQALTYPDDSWREWSFKDNLNTPVSRENINIFTQAALNVRATLIALGFDEKMMSQIDENKYRAIFAEKNQHAERFDEITAQHNPKNINISYKHWRELTLRPVQSSENIWFIKDPDSFESSEWYLFQECARDIRQFFKREIFPNLSIQTKVY